MFFVWYNYRESNTGDMRPRPIPVAPFNVQLTPSQVFDLSCDYPRGQQNEKYEEYLRIKNKNRLNRRF